MRRVQEVALDAFEAHGYDAVSVEDIARAADVGPATIYRNFGTKEGIVLWDDYDPRLLEAVGAALADRELDVVQATMRGLGEALAAVYDADADRILQRTRLVKATPALTQASAAQPEALRGALAGTLRAAGRAKDDLEAQVFAGALVAALLAGLDRWLDAGGKEPLARCLKLAFDRLRKIARP